MENTVVDSNSESDISDSWAVIDDGSPREWNNENSLSHQYDFVKSRVDLPKSNSSKSELSSDEDSIEVVAEDETDNLCDEGVEVVQDEEWSGTDQLESTEKICTRTCLLTPDLPRYTTQLKTINHKWRESNLILIGILIMGILGGLCLGYLWASHSCKCEDSTSNSIQPTSALLTELQNEIRFLRRQLWSTSSLKAAVSKTNIPKLNHVTKQDLHTKTTRIPFEVVSPGMCSITDFIGKSPIFQDNFSKEYCLASDRPRGNENGWTNSANNVSMNIVQASSLSTGTATPVKKHLVEENGRLNSNIPNEYTPEDISFGAKQIYQTFPESTENAYFEPFDNHQHVNTIETEPNSGDIDNDIARETSETTVGNEEIMFNIEGRSDPRPYTKLRTTVERIYAILSVIDNEHQPVLPSQLELLSILPQNIAFLDLSKGHFTTNVYDKVTSLTIQMHDITQQLFADVDLSINNCVWHITSKIKEIETFNKKQICNLKTILESSADIALLDLDHEPIFRECIQEDKQNDDIDLVKNEIKSVLTESKDIFMVSDTSSNSDQNKPGNKIKQRKFKDYIYHKLERGHENMQKSDTQDLNEFGDAREEEEREERRGPKNSRDLNKKSRKVEKITLENKSQLKESIDTPVEPEADTYTEKKIKSNIVKSAKKYKSAAKHSKLQVTKKREKYSKKKNLNYKENEYNNEYYGKDQKYIDHPSRPKWMLSTNRTSTGSNVSGEWAIKMANGRAEQRRRDHQSDWVFERAKSRMSNRKKSVKESYWHEDREYSSKLSSYGVCNNALPFKERTAKRWNEVKQHVKKNLWKPIVDSAKTVKKAFNKFNNKLRYHSHHE